MPGLRHILALGLALGSAPAWGTGGKLPDGMSEFIETRYTHTSLDGDSRPDVERTFDEFGGLVRAVYTTVTPEGSQSEIMTVDARAGTRTLEAMRRGRVIRREVETFTGREVLIQRETWREGADGTAETRTVETFLGLDVVVDEFTRTRDGRWEKIGTSRRSGLHIRRDPPPPFEVTSETRLYAECLRERANPTDPDALIDPYYTGNVNVDTCSRQLTDLIDERGLDYERYANLRCTSATDFFLPNGFRIDRASCFGIPPDVRGSGNARGWTHDVLDLSSRLVTNQSDGMLACLNTINAPLARKVARALVEKRPRLQCRGAADLPAMEEAVCGEEAAAACTSRLPPLMEHSGAFYTESRPHDLFLTNHDPSKEVPPEVERDGDGELPLNEDVRNRYQSHLQTRSDQVASTLFHELLHAAGLHGSAHHNDADGDMTDAVYGCQAVCGGASENLTREGCLACLGAESNRPSRANTAACNGLPRKGAMDAAKRAGGVSRDMFRCLENRKSDNTACTALEAAEGYPPECEGKYPWEATCARHIRVWIGRLIREGATAFSASEIADAFTVDSGTFTPNVAGGRLAFGSITIGSDGTEPTSARRFLNLTVSHAFCSEVMLGATVTREGGTRTVSINATAAAALRSAYDSSLPSLSRAERDELITFGSGDATVTQPVWKRSGYGGTRAWTENFMSYCDEVGGKAGRGLYARSVAGRPDVVPAP